MRPSLRLTRPWGVLNQADDHRESIFYYMVFLIVVEFALRLLLAVGAFLVSLRKPKPKKRSADRSDSAPEPPPEEQPPEEEGRPGRRRRRKPPPRVHSAAIRST